MNINKNDIDRLYALEYSKSIYDEEDGSEPYVEYEVEGTSEDGERLFWDTIEDSELNDVFPDYLVKMIRNGIASAE